MILNLTQHNATPGQIEAGVVDHRGEPREVLVQFLSFADIPTAEEIRTRAKVIAERAAETGHRRAMIGGALWLMAPLAEELRGQGIEPVFAFSRREVVEEAQADGTVKKVAVFRHAGWVPAV